MKNHKRDFIPFSFYDRTGMAAHLEKRAAEGWLLDKVTPFGWHYRRIEPAKLHFTVTYDHRLSEFAPAPTEVNRVVTLGVDVLLALALWGVLTAMLLSGVRSGAFSSESGVEPPLQMQALTGEEGKYVTNTRLEETVFLSKLEVSQYVRWQEGEILPGLEYTLVEVKCPPFYDLCLDEMLKEYQDWSFDEPEFRYVYEPCDPAPWGAEKAYQLTLGGEARDRYLLCWPDRLVSLELDFTPTAEQMALAGERLQAG